MFELQKEGKEEKKKEKKGGENMDGGGDKGGEKKVGGPITVVLQLDIHCVGCARKIKKSVKNFEGTTNLSLFLFVLVKFGIFFHKLFPPQLGS